MTKYFNKQENQMNCNGDSIKLKKCKPVYEVKEKIAVYMKPHSIERLRKYANSQGITMSDALLKLANDGMTYRKNKGLIVP